MLRFRLGPVLTTSSAGALACLDVDVREKENAP
jgi:hypothetical protein